MLKLQNVSKKLESFRLNNISMELPEGYIMGLIGPNGAGKTSILHIMLGLYQPEQGTVELFGKQYATHEKEIKNNIGYVLTEPLFCRDISLAENAQMFGKYYDNYDKTLFSGYCQRFHLAENRTLKKLSKGEDLKFQFAFALSHRPKLLILDEPTANFDPEFRQEFIHILTDFVKDGAHSVILATHLTNDLDRIADYLTFVNKGKLIFSSDKETLTKQYRFVSGEDYKINLLPKECIIYKEKGSFGSKALVRHDRWTHYDAALTVTSPSVEELMYYILKGGCHAETRSERL